MDWKDIVSSVAPTIGAALGGPMGAAAVKFIASEFVGSDDVDEDGVAEIIAGSSFNELSKLKSLDNQFKLEMKALNIDVYALEVQDRDSARDLFKTSVWPQITLSTAFVGGYFLVLYFLMSSGLADGESMLNNPVFTTILGVLTAAIPQILNFWFGSSLGSKEKTNAMRVK